MSKIFKIAFLIIIISFGVILAKNYNDKQEINTPKESVNSSDKNTDSSKKDYDILVSSNKHNVLVSLNKDTKDVNVKALDDTKDIPTSNKYIKVNDEDLKYLEENSDAIFNELKRGSSITKYALLNEKLKNYDTNISPNDLKNLVFNYIK